MERLTHQETETARVIGLAGEIIMEAVIEMQPEITRLVQETRQPAVILDLAGVTFLDSSGLGMLIGLRRLCDEQGKAFSLANPAPSIRKLLDMLRLTEYFTLPARNTAAA